MRMDGKHTSMWGVWIILSVAVLVSLGVGLYFIIKHSKRCKPDCSGQKCTDGCGKSCGCTHGCDGGKCKNPPTSAAVNSSWNSTTKSTGKNHLKRLLQNSNDQVLNNQLPESVIECALKKIMDIYKNPQDFIKALNSQNMLNSLITIVKNCMKESPVDPPDPSTVCKEKCKIGESCLKNECIPNTWTTEFYNKFRDNVFSDPIFNQKGMNMNKHIASCITDGMKRKYSNPQRMAKELDIDTIVTMLKNLYTQCTKEHPHPHSRPHSRPHRHPHPQNPCNITISDECIRKGQDARNNDDDCVDTINECEIIGGGTITQDCQDELRRISAETCHNMTRHKPRRHRHGDEGYYYCNPAVPDFSNKRACGSCMFVTDEDQVPEGFPRARGVIGPDGNPNCSDLDFCQDKMYCHPEPNTQLSSRIYPSKFEPVGPQPGDYYCNPYPSYNHNDPYAY